jgi:MoaA/NifB/PqqE/SkfB family radical SAM enzyme
MNIFEFRRILPEIPRIFFKRSFRFEFEKIPMEARELSLRKIVNLFVSGLNRFLLPNAPLGIPVTAQVEPTNICNLRCPLCATHFEDADRPRTMLPFETFRSFIDELGGSLLLIVMWCWGEPLLNPDIYRMIRYARDHGVLCHLSSNMNVPLTDEQARSLVASGLESLVVAADAVSQHTYQAYRVGGSIDQVVENTRKIVTAKKALQSETPKVTLRAVAMRHNEAEIPKLAEMAEELGVDYFSVKSTFLPATVKSEVRRRFAPKTVDLQRYRSGSRRTGIPSRSRFKCVRPWKRLTLLATGEVVPCEFDYRALYPFGRANRSVSFTNTWKSGRGRAFRAIFNWGRNNYYFCKICPYKENRVKDCVLDLCPVRDGSGGKTRSVPASG